MVTPDTAANPAVLSLLLRPVTQLAHTLRTYRWATARGDLTAGATVAVVAIPQSMAYAALAHVPPQYGLYTLILQSLVGSLLTSQPLLSMGPIITQSLLTASVAGAASAKLAPGDEAMYLKIVLALTLIKGVLQLGMAAARLGTLVRYVSHSVIVGFTSGAGVLIAASQVAPFLGFSTDRSVELWPGLIGIAQGVLPELHRAHWGAAALGVASLAIVLGGRAWSRLAPGPLVAVALSAGAVWWWWGLDAPFRLVGTIPTGLDALHEAVRLPSVSLGLAEALLPGALALALLGLMEAYSIGKSLAMQRGGRVSANQELFGQGATHVAGAFLGSIPGSASFSRSALNAYAGAHTALAGVFNAAFVLAIFLLAAPAAAYIPMSSIAAILFVIAYGLVDWRYFRRVARTSRGDFAVLAGTFLATLLMPLAYAVFVGIALNLALYLRKASQLHMLEMIDTPAGPFIERPVSDRHGSRRVMFLQLEGDLFFGLADELSDRLSALGRSGVRVVVLRLKRTHSIDSTVLGVLEDFVHQMRDRDAHVLLCGVRPELKVRLDAYGLTTIIGNDHVFPTGVGVFSSAKLALQRARELVQDSIDAEAERAMTSDEEA